jgi:hypothetical protein
MKKFLSSILRKNRFLGEHYGDVVADRINALAGVALQPTAVRYQVHRTFTDWAYKDSQKFLGN